jgi:uncharacterized phage-like protein YoqJ
MDAPIAKSICFTGHRALPRQKIAALEETLCNAILSYAEQGYTTFLCGGAIGFDMLSAICVLNCKNKLPSIQLHLILPCQNHTAAWSARDLTLLDRIRMRANSVHYVSDAPYQAGCMQARNRYLVDHADLCLSYKTSERGGTAYTVRYAQKKGVPVRNLAQEL